MEKIYIATSTLNFNNILSTESISPEIFYLKRNFGYKRFTKVEPNPFSNSLIAYDKLPLFKIAESDYEDYPLIIEISKDIIKDDMISNSYDEKGIKIFQINKTIYLHPSKTTFLFTNEKDLKLALIKTEPSIETKLLPVYKDRLKIITKDKNSFKWNKKILKNIEDLKTDNLLLEIENDSKINKLKGFYYSYLIGILYSIPLIEQITRKSFLSISSSLNNLFNKIECIKNKEKCITELDKIYNDFTKSLAKFKNTKISAYSPLSLIKNLNFNGYKITQLNDNFLDNKESELFRNILNDIIDYPINDTQTFNAEKVELAYKIGALLKDYYPNWETGLERQYFNSLMDSIEKFQDFEIKSHSSILFQSIALFIQKGDDIEKLIKFLEKNEMPDYRIALGLWGIIFGFSALPKTLTNPLFNENYIDLTRKIYQDIQTKLHNNITKSVDFQNIQNKPKQKRNNTEIKTYNSESESNVKSVNKEKVIVDNNKTSVSKTQNVSNNELIEKQSLKNKLKPCKLKAEQLESIDIIFKNNNYIINNKLFTDIKKIRGIGDKTIEKIKKALNYNDNIDKSIPKLPFDKTYNRQPFYKDTKAFNYVEQYIMQKKKKQFKKDLEWFQKEISKGSESKYFKNVKKDNTSVLEAMQRFFYRRIEKGMYSNDELSLSKIIQILRNIYE